MTQYYTDIPYLWTNQVELRTGKMLEVGFSLAFHNDGKKKYYVLYQHVGYPQPGGKHNLNFSGENFQIKEFPQVYNKALLLEYMEMKGYKQKEAA
jgi:hypothetical protein